MPQVIIRNPKLVNTAVEDVTVTELQDGTVLLKGPITVLQPLADLDAAVSKQTHDASFVERQAEAWIKAVAVTQQETDIANAIRKRFGLPIITIQMAAEIGREQLLQNPLINVVVNTIKED